MNLDATVAGRSYRVEVRADAPRYLVRVDGHLLEVDWQDSGGDFASLIVDGHSYQVGVSRASGGYTVVLDEAELLVEVSQGASGTGPLAKHAPSGPSKITAPMPGKIVRVLIELGQEVAAGQGLVVMEAMKMENELRAPRAGRVEALGVREGQAVETGSLLVALT